MKEDFRLTNTKAITAVMVVIEKYNKDDRLVYRKYADGFEIFLEYDEQGRKIYYKEQGIGHIYDCYYEYNSVNKITHISDSRGKKEWYDYDVSGNIIYYRCESNYGNGLYEEWTKYDKNNRRISCKNSNGGESWWRYLDDGATVECCNSKGKKWIEKIK